MDNGLAALLADLEQFGADNDERADARSEKLLNITRDTGQFLSLLIQALRSRRIVEIGTSNGYSTLWLADAARATGGAVDTVERRTSRAGMAAETFGRSGLAPWITLHTCEAGSYLAGLPGGSVDFLFLDAERTEYPGYWPDIQRVLPPGALIVADNAISHQAEMAPFVALLAATPVYLTSLVPVGKGELLVLKLA